MRRRLRNGCTNLHFILLKVLKIKPLRKIKNRIKIIVVLADLKARFFILGVLFSLARVSINHRGSVLILLDLFCFQSNVYKPRRLLL